MPLNVVFTPGFLYHLIKIIEFNILISFNCSSLADSLSIASNIKCLKGIKILNLNIQSLFYKVDEIKLMVLESDPDILGITETWLHDGIDNSEIHIPNYALCRNDRAEWVWWCCVLHSQQDRDKFDLSVST